MNSKLDAKVYLSATDWYIIRKIEREIDIPNDIKEKRQLALDIIRGIKPEKDWVT